MMACTGLVAKPIINCFSRKINDVNIFKSLVQSHSCVSYQQGQSPEPNIREYFYFIDHQGMLFLDDARIKNFTSCFKEKKFLVFFFSRLRANTTGRYPEFPFFSPCGREKNFIRCDDLPFVFTHVDDDRLCYAHAGNELSEQFKPNMVTMVPSTGRVYHPASERAGGVGLVKSSLAIDFSNRFQFDNGEDKPPTHFSWQNIQYKLKTWYEPSNIRHADSGDT